MDQNMIDGGTLSGVLMFRACSPPHLTSDPQANYRTQLILRADILQEEPGRSDSDMPQILLVNDTTIERIINAKTLDGILIDG